MVVLGIATCALGWNMMHGSSVAFQIGFCATAALVALLVVRPASVKIEGSMR